MVEQDQPLPTFQRSEIDGDGQNSDRNQQYEDRIEDTARVVNAEDKGQSSAFMSPITQTSQLDSTEKKKRQYVNNNLQRMIKLASKIDQDKRKKRQNSSS